MLPSTRKDRCTKNSTGSDEYTGLLKAWLGYPGAPCCDTGNKKDDALSAHMGSAVVFPWSARVVGAWMGLACSRASAQQGGYHLARLAGNAIHGSYVPDWQLAGDGSSCGKRWPRKPMHEACSKLGRAATRAPLRPTHSILQDTAMSRRTAGRCPHRPSCTPAQTVTKCKAAVMRLSLGGRHPLRAVCSARATAPTARFRAPTRPAPLPNIPALPYRHPPWRTAPRHVSTRRAPHT